MLLAEWVRRVGEEKSLLDDSAQYTYSIGGATLVYLGTEKNTNSTTYVLLWEQVLTPADSLKRIRIKRVEWTVKVSGGTGYWKITAQSGGGGETQLYEGSTTSTGWSHSGVDVGFAGGLGETVYLRYYGKISASSYIFYLGAGSGATQYYYFTPGWYLIKDYGVITLTKTSIVAFSYDVVAPASSAYGNTFIAIGDYKVGGGSVYNGETKTFNGLIVLPAGSYSVKAYGIMDTDSRSISVKNMKIGVVAFSDLAYVAAQQYSQSLSISLSSRKTCVGRTIAGNCIVYVQAFAWATIKFLNPGETAGTYQVAINVDGVQRAWSVRNQDVENASASGSASAMLAIQLSLDAEHTIEIVKNEQVTVILSVVFSPWLLGSDDLSPVILEFPTGSTLYVTAEPLIADATKSIKIGRKRAVSLGGVTDYYATQSGTGIITLAYTFDYLPTGEPLLAVSGLNCCVSLIGVDVRA